MVIIYYCFIIFLFSEDFMKRFLCYSLLLVSSVLFVVACKKDPIVEEQKSDNISVGWKLGRAWKR